MSYRPDQYVRELRKQILEQIDGDSPTDSQYSRWVELCDMALGDKVDPWAAMNAHQGMAPTL